MEFFRNVYRKLWRVLIVILVAGVLLDPCNQTEKKNKTTTHKLIKMNFCERDLDRLWTRNDADLG